VIDVVEILQHWHAGRPKAVIAESLGVDRRTVRKYVEAVEAHGLSPGGPALSREEWSELVRQLFPSLVDARARMLTFPAIDAFRDEIGEMLKANTVTTVHQRLRDEHGLAVGISSFRRYCWEVFPCEVRRESVTVPRPEVEPGSEAQIDYGYLGTFLDPRIGKPRRVWAFIMVLAFSRHLFVRPVVKMDQVSWVACHVAAFDYFGGVPRRLVPDNLKTGVLRPDIYDPKLNRTYGELADHYDCLIDPARGGKPKDKPRVERIVPYVRDSFYRGREWGSEPELWEKAPIWCTEVAGARQLRIFEGASALSIFEAAEASALGPLPLFPFEIAAWSYPLVGRDCYAKVGKALYTVPWVHMGQRLDAREGHRTVEFFADGTLVKTWSRIERGRQRDWGDYPPEKAAFFMKDPAWCRHRAGEIGTSAVEVVRRFLAGGALHNLRSAQGVIRLTERYGTARVEAACRRSLEVGDPGYRTIKGILVAGTELDGQSLLQVPEAPAHLHGPDTLFSHLEEVEV